MLSRCFALVVILWKVLHFCDLQLLGVPHLCCYFKSNGCRRYYHIFAHYKQIAVACSIAKVQEQDVRQSCLTTSAIWSRSERVQESWAFLMQLEVTSILCKTPEDPRARITSPQGPTIYLVGRKAKCISFMQASLTPLTALHLWGQGLRTKGSN